MIDAAEWPASWAKPRGDLVRALEDLVHLVDVTKPESAFSRLGVSPPRTPFAMGSVALRVVVHLLAAPCPPGELRYIAALCNLVLVMVSGANRFELVHRGPDVPAAIEVAHEELRRCAVPLRRSGARHQRRLWRGIVQPPTIGPLMQITRLEIIGSCDPGAGAQLRDREQGALSPPCLARRERGGQDDDP